MMPSDAKLAELRCRAARVSAAVRVRMNDAGRVVLPPWFYWRVRRQAKDRVWEVIEGDGQ